MKKIISLILICAVILVGCSSEEENQATKSSDLTLDLLIEAFESEGIEVNRGEKPAFSMINAKDGVMFYIDNQVVKIYEFDSEESIKKGEEVVPSMADWERNGLFIIETNSQQAKDIFNSVK